MNGTLWIVDLSEGVLRDLRGLVFRVSLGVAGSDDFVVLDVSHPRDERRNSSVRFSDLDLFP